MDPRYQWDVSIGSAGIEWRWAFIFSSFFDGLGGPSFSLSLPMFPSVTDAYSWRLLLNFQPHKDFMADIQAVFEANGGVSWGEGRVVFLPEKV